jgi:cobalamin biosynthesis Mg chelatase CobN
MIFDQELDEAVSAVNDGAQSPPPQDDASLDPTDSTSVAVDAITIEDLRDEGEIPYPPTMVHEFIAASLAKTIREYQRRTPGVAADDSSYQLWVEKYRPSAVKEVCGNMNWTSFIHGWLQFWQYAELPDEEEDDNEDKLQNEEDEDVDIDDDSDSDSESDDGGGARKTPQPQRKQQASSSGSLASFFGISSSTPKEKENSSNNSNRQVAGKSVAVAKSKLMSDEGWANAMIIQGKKGIGKTAAVRAVANELGFKVISSPLFSFASVAYKVEVRLG